MLADIITTDCVVDCCEIESRSVVSDSLQPHGLYSPWNSPGQNTGVDSHFLLQGIFPTPEIKQVSRIADIFFTLTFLNG